MLIVTPRNTDIIISMFVSAPNTTFTLLKAY